MVEHNENDPNEVLRNYVLSDEGANDWPHKQTAVWLYRMSHIVGNVLYGGEPKLPPVLVGIGPMRVEIYAGYYLQRNELGLRYLIKFNELHIGRSRWSLAETLVHEMGHVVQEELFKNGAKPPYHNKVFVDMLEELGIHPKLGEGYHTRPADLDGQFGRLLSKLGIPPDPKITQGDTAGPATGKDGRSPKRPWWEDDKRKGASTLKLYTAPDCAQDPVCKIRLGKALRLQCLDCQGVFKPA